MDATCALAPAARVWYTVSVTFLCGTLYTVRFACGKAMKLCAMVDNLISALEDNCSYAATTDAHSQPCMRSVLCCRFDISLAPWVSRPSEAPGIDAGIVLCERNGNVDSNGQVVFQVVQPKSAGALRVYNRKKGFCSMMGGDKD
jgi:hypothetical protein